MRSSLTLCYSKVLLGTVLLASAMATPAQTYPSRPIKLIIPLAAGGATDALARIVTQKMSEAWGQQIVIENRAGAGGNIGTEYVARSTADGYTMLLIASSTFTITANLYPKLPYDARRDLTPVSILAAGPYMLTVHPSLPAKTFKDLVALDKARPRDLNYGSGGTGTIHALWSLAGLGALDKDTKQFVQTVADDTVRKFYGR